MTEGIQYPDGSLTGSGTIEGKAVRCIAPEFMVRFHSGYEPRETDMRDVVALCESSSSTTLRNTGISHHRPCSELF